MQLKNVTLFAASLFAASTTAYGSCPVGSQWADPYDCHRFWECASGGEPVLKECGAGTAYNPRIGVCDHEGSVPSCWYYIPWYWGF